MRLPVVVAAGLEQVLGAPVHDARYLGGGTINTSALVAIAGQRVFVKWHQGAPPGFFAAEVDGLARLRATATVRVPDVIAHHDGAPVSWLALPAVTPGARTGPMFEEAGRALARLHACRGERSGLERQNVIGSIPQDNRCADGWGWREFFVHKRLRVFDDILPTRLKRKLDRFDFERWLPEPDGGPALLHGDLWSGNLMADRLGCPWFIDPAVYFGHPEIDLAMTRHWGGFDERFYRAYAEVAGEAQPEQDARFEILNLYTLLVHARIFGGYLNEVDTVLTKYG